MFEERKQARLEQDMFDKELKHDGVQGALRQSEPEDVSLVPRERLNDLTIWQQRFDEDIILTVHDIKREEYDSINNKWVVIQVFKENRIVNGKEKKVMKPLKPMMNSLGITAFKMEIRSLVNRNLIMSNYSEAEANNKIKYCTFVWINQLSLHQKDYEISKDDMSLLVRIFKDLIEPSVKRAINSGERSYLNSIVKRMEVLSSTTNPDQEKKKGFLQGFMG